MKNQKDAHVKLDIDGTAIFARNFIDVLEVVFLTKLFNNVFANKGNFGMDLLVWSSHNAAVEKDGIKNFFKEPIEINSQKKKNSLFCFENSARKKIFPMDEGKYHLY